MSKSKGEFTTVSTLEERGYDPLIYRLFCLQSHYRKALVFSYENLDNARAAYEKLVARVAALTGEGEVDPAVFGQYQTAFKEALGNDLNTSLAVTRLYDVLKADANDATKRALIESFDQVLGLDLLKKAAAYREKQAAPAGGEDAAEIEALVAARTAAKKAKDWAEADRIRDQLKEMGVELIDTKEGTQWRRA